MTNTQSHAVRELEILSKTVPDALILEFTPQILALCEAFGKSGQSGGSAPYTAGALAAAIKKLCLQKTISPLTGEESEWGTVADNLYQNNRDSAVFRNSIGGKAYYLNAIVFKGQDPGDTFTGTVQNIRSRQFIKSFPFTPKTFYIDVVRFPFDPSIHPTNESVTCGSGNFIYQIADSKQLDEMFEYYDKYFEEKNDLNT